MPHPSRQQRRSGADQGRRSVAPIQIEAVLSNALRTKTGLALINAFMSIHKYHKVDTPVKFKRRGEHRTVSCGKEEYLFQNPLYAQTPNEIIKPLKFYT